MTNQSPVELAVHFVARSMLRSLIGAVIGAAPDRAAFLAAFKERAYADLAGSMDVLAANNRNKANADELSVIDKSIWAEFDWYMSDATKAAAKSP